MNSKRVPNTGRNSADMIGSFVSLFVPTCVGSYRNHMWGSSHHSKAHLGAFTSKPHLRFARSSPPPPLKSKEQHVPTTQARLKTLNKRAEQEHVSSGTSMRSQKMNCCKELMSARDRLNAEVLSLHSSEQPWLSTECHRCMSILSLRRLTRMYMQRVQSQSPPFRYTKHSHFFFRKVPKDTTSSGSLSAFPICASTSASDSTWSSLVTFRFAFFASAFACLFWYSSPSCPTFAVTSASAASRSSSRLSCASAFFRLFCRSTCAYLSFICSSSGDSSKSLCKMGILAFRYLRLCSW
mmetsp:Transcript_86305/g.172706  ORF Transcript_86305/g.172706 Transcript_86305/m.172706 type:complete len:295 (-) Transcript_86305:289-1173(-)